jgi:hypothetical protein
MARNFLSRTKLVKVKDHSASSTDAVESSIVDTAGYEGVVFFTSFGTANATNSIKVQTSATNATDNMADVLGTSVSSGKTNEDLVLEVYRPTQRYLQVVVTRRAATTCESIWADLYGGAAEIANNSVAGTQVAELHSSPALGTA